MVAWVLRNILGKLQQLVAAIIYLEEIGRNSCSTKKVASFQQTCVIFCSVKTGLQWVVHLELVDFDLIDFQLVGFSISKLVDKGYAC